jgi:hypothetical protein
VRPGQDAFAKSRKDESNLIEKKGSALERFACLEDAND